MDVLFTYFIIVYIMGLIFSFDAEAIIIKIFNFFFSIYTVRTEELNEFASL